MKQIIRIFFLTLLLASCEREAGRFENKAFINADEFKNEVRVATDEGVSSMTRSITVAIAQPLENELKLSVRRDAGLLETYRHAYYDPTAELLPEENCNPDGLEAVIKAGDISSGEIGFKFTGLDKLDYSRQYVLPVTITSEGIEVLERAKTMYFVVRKAALVNSAADMYTNCAWPVWDGWEKVADLETFTMEALINCHAFKNESMINTIMGIEDHFLIRVGDTQIATNQVQIATAVVDVEGNSIYRIGVTNPSMQLQTGRWYHLAVTFDKGLIKVYIDGRLRAEQNVNPIAQRPGPDGNLVDVPFTSVDFSAPHSDESDGKPRCFWLGYSYDANRSFNGMMAEARVWNRVLSAEEINEEGHFYKLYPSDIDESLLAYWKFSEGKGKIIEDHSIYGKDLQAERNLVWYSVELPEN